MSYNLVIFFTSSGASRSLQNFHLSGGNGEGGGPPHESDTSANVVKRTYQHFSPGNAHELIKISQI